MQLRLGPIVALVVLCPATCVAADFQPIVLEPTYNHDRFKTQPRDIVWEFRAYTTSFDGPDDNNADSRGEKWGIPEWVAYELRAEPPDLGPTPSFSGSWITDANLHADGTAPNHASYTTSDYSRGHMCMNAHAFRLGADAAWNTHTVLNACPQKQLMNNGVWKGLELKTDKWANKFGAVWIVCGPVIYGRTPSEWIGDEGEVPVAVPDAFYKIVVKDSSIPGGKPDVLAFVIPMTGVGNYNSSNHDLTPYLTSVDTVEALTGLNFLTSLDDDVEAELERVVHIELWEQ